MEGGVRGRVGLMARLTRPSGAAWGAAGRCFAARHAPRRGAPSERCAGRAGAVTRRFLAPHPVVLQARNTPPGHVKPCHSALLPACLASPATVQLCCPTLPYPQPGARSAGKQLSIQCRAPGPSGPADPCCLRARGCLAAALTGRRGAGGQHGVRARRRAAGARRVRAGAPERGHARLDGGPARRAHPGVPGGPPRGRVGAGLLQRRAPALVGPLEACRPCRSRIPGRPPREQMGSGLLRWRAVQLIESLKACIVSPALLVGRRRGRTGARPLKKCDPAHLQAISAACG